MPLFGVRRQSEARRRFGLRDERSKAVSPLRSATALQRVARLRVNKYTTMKRKPIYLVLLIALLLGSDLAHGQDSLEAQPKKARTRADYKLRTLKEIGAAGSDLVSETGGEANDEATTRVHGDLLPSRVRVTYKGLARPLAQNKKDVISRWAQRYAGNPDHYTVPYTTEMLFTEDGVDHWLVVKKASLPEFRRKLQRGRVVDLYLIRLGAFKTSGKWRWVLLVETFATPR